MYVLQLCAFLHPKPVNIMQNIWYLGYGWKFQIDISGNYRKHYASKCWIPEEWYMYYLSYSRYLLLPQSSLFFYQNIRICGSKRDSTEYSPWQSLSSLDKPNKCLTSWKGQQLFLLSLLPCNESIQCKSRFLPY